MLECTAFCFVKLPIFMGIFWCILRSLFVGYFDSSRGGISNRFNLPYPEKRSVCVKPITNTPMFWASGYRTWGRFGCHINGYDKVNLICAILLEGNCYL